MQTELLSMPGRYYTISSCEDVFDAGILPDGRQVLAGIQLPEIVVVYFSSQGILAGVTVTTIASEDRSPIDQASVELARWKSVVGFRANAIRVQPFFLRDRWIGIADLPPHYQKVLDHPEDIDEVRLAELLTDIRQWQHRGDFVCYWDEDYYFDKNGELASS